jgi:gp16 family phage-associated protein
VVQLNPDKLQKARAEFFLAGLSIAEWARENRFRQDLVYAVLSGRSKATRGESHRIAVKLGLKATQPSVPSPDVEETM